MRIYSRFLDKLDSLPLGSLTPKYQTFCQNNGPTLESPQVMADLKAGAVMPKLNYIAISLSNYNYLVVVPVQNYLAPDFKRN